MNTGTTAAVSSATLEAATTTAAAAASETLLASSNNKGVLATLVGFVRTVLFRLISFATISVPLFFYRILTWSFTLHLSFSSVLLIFFAIVTGVYLVVRYRYLNKYSRLKPSETPKSTSSFFDLHPNDLTEEDEEEGAKHGGFKNYPDEFLSAFLSSIKIFGYLEQHVFHELARHLQTKKLLAGDTLFRNNPEQERSFYIVVHGHVQLLVKPDKDDEQEDSEDDESSFDHTQQRQDKFRNYTLLNEVGPGGTLSSLFTILNVFRETVLRGEMKGGKRFSNKTSATVDASHEKVFPNLLQQPELFTDKKGKMHHPLTRLQRPSSAASESRHHSRENSDMEEAVESDDGIRKLPANNDTPIDHKAAGGLMPDFAAVAGLPSRRQYLSVHPNIVARATVDTTLAVIPEEAFHKLAQKFPKASAHIVQVILTRFQRVTLTTGHRYLGLTKELLIMQKLLDESASMDALPEDLFVPGGMERLRRKFARPDEDESDGDNKGGHPPQQLAHKESSSSGIIQAMDIPSTPSLGKSTSTGTAGVSVGGSGSPGSSSGLTATSPSQKQREENAEYSVKDDEHLRASVMRCLSDCLGLKSPREEEHHRPSSPHIMSSPRTARMHPWTSSNTSSPAGPPESLKSSSRYYYPMDLISHAGTVDASASPSLGALSIPYDDDIESSSVSSFQSGSDMTGHDYYHHNSFSSNDIQILFFPKDAVLVKEGEHNNGLFFVIDGLLDASISPADCEDLSLERDQSSSDNDERSSSKKRRKKRENMFWLSSSPIPSPSSSTSSVSSLASSNQVMSKETAAGEGGVTEALEGTALVQRHGPVLASKAPAGREPNNMDDKDERKKAKKPSFTIKPGGLAGYFAAVTGNPSLVEIRAKTDTYVAFVSRKSLDRIIDKHPGVMLKLATRLVGTLSPLMLYIDLALEWMQVNAGQIICKEGQPSESIYMVLHGRLRTIRNKKEGGIEIVGEFGHKDCVCELEALAGIPSPSTLHAIRDSELARMPKNLFNALALRHPEITLQISRMVAFRALQTVTSATPGKGNNMVYLKNSRPGSGSGSSTLTAANPITPELYGHNNANLKTVGIIPVNASVPVTEFAENLKSALIHSVGATCVLLNSATITSVMGKHAFSRLGQLKLASWLAEQEEKFRIVLYLADSGVKSQWTRTCIRQADTILLVGLGDGDPSVGEYERFLINMKTTARKELVLLHGERSCATGTTQNWLKNRLWIQAHHHIFMPMRQHTTLSDERLLFRPPWLAETGRKMTANSINMMKNVKGQLEKYYSAVPTFGRLLVLKKSDASRLGSASNAARDDFARLARRLCGKSVALVLGGGGARGISHIGVIQALEEAGIPIDIIGGTSIGSFVGGLYAKNRDLVSTIARSKLFSHRVTSIWRNLMDLTYPVTAWFTGHEFNRSIYKCLGDSQIEDFWLPYFAVTTNITYSRMEVHTTGYAWRYIRASMSLSGYLPPICDNGNMLVDGGYMDNLPVSVAKSMGADIIIAVDVQSEDDTSPVHYGDSISGWWAMLYNCSPFRSYNIPSIAEIQSRLAYVSSVSKLEEAKVTDGTLYLKLPVQQWGTLDFHKFSDIMQLGYNVGRQVVDEWRKAGYASGRLLKTDPVTTRGKQVKGKRGRRNSI